MKVSLSARIEQASKVFPQSEELLKTTMENLGVDDAEIGMSVLEGDYITFEDFKAALTNAIIDLNDGSAGLVMPPPVPRLKLIWSILKGEDKKPVATEVSSELSELIKTVKPMAQWSNLELLEKYCKECVLTIQEELAKRAKNRFVIVFNEDESVDIGTSLHMLKKAQYQETPQVYKLRSGEHVQEVYRVGDFPMQVFYECPTHKDVLLLDGYCEECCDHWDVSDTEKNTLLRLISENESGIDIHQYREKNLDDLKKRFPKTYLLHKNLKEEDNLPRLKRKISKPKSGDPFRVVGTHRIF